MKMAAIYARVSSEQQREEHTIASQTAALIEWAKTLDLEVPTGWVVEDEGYSGATLERPGLERARSRRHQQLVRVGELVASESIERIFQLNLQRATTGAPLSHVVGVRCRAMRRAPR